MQHRWLEWAQRLQSIAQAGLEYSKDRFDRERFSQIRALSTEIMHSYTDISHEKLTDLFANESGYQTPKVDVRAAVAKGDKLLFVREADDGKWALPGGWAEIRHSIRENAEKEVREESGVNAIADSLIAVLDRNRHVKDSFPYSVYKVFVLCRAIDGSFAPNIETLDAGFFARDELPELSVLRNTPEQVAMCFDFLNGDRNEVHFD